MSSDSAHTAQAAPRDTGSQPGKRVTRFRKRGICIPCPRAVLLASSLQHAENQACEQQRNVRAASEALPKILFSAFFATRLADISVKHSVLPWQTYRIRYHEANSKSNCLQHGFVIARSSYTYFACLKQTRVHIRLRTAGTVLRHNRALVLQQNWALAVIESTEIVCFKVTRHGPLHTALQACRHCVLLHDRPSSHKRHSVE
jgi:hypothetical protein